MLEDGNATESAAGIVHINNVNETTAALKASIGGVGRLLH